jgi:bacterioferritin-associated ferredoxin
MADSAKSNSLFTVELDGRDRIEATKNGNSYSLSVVGCSKLLKLLGELKTKFGGDISKWQIPDGESHEFLLVRELVLRVRGEWKFPYEHAELCHCRNIPARNVDQAIISGAHSTDVVSRRTSASTACGTCRPNVQKIIDYRLGKKAA